MRRPGFAKTELTRAASAPLSRGQDTGSELWMALADDAYGDGDALVEGLAGDSMGADYVAEFVLRVTFGGRGDSFV